MAVPEPYEKVDKEKMSVLDYEENHEMMLYILEGR